MGKRLFILCITAFFASTCIAQQLNEFDLIKQQNFTQKKYNKRSVSYLFKNNKNVIVKYNPISLAFGGLLYFYQKAISPQVSVDCPYEISCSNFSKQCIQHYGLIKGVALTADRLTRCTQFTLIDLKPIDFNKNSKIIDPIERYSKHSHGWK